MTRTFRQAAALPLPTLAMRETTEPQLSKLYQIDDTVNVMRQNIQRTEERGAHIDHIEDQTKGLSISADQFKRGTNRVRKNFMWKNIRMWIWITLGVIVFIVVIALAVHFGKK
ncbi:MAG: hypothetical protein Q9181_008091 [Wetmoreana brouardii]